MNVIESTLSSILAAVFIGLATWLYKVYKNKKNNKKEEAPPAKVQDSSISILERLRFLIKKKNISNEKLFYQMKKTTAFFSDRFSGAFPGCRDIQEFNDPKQALHRLDVLLAAPLSVTLENSGINPIWWYRGNHNLHISSYKKLRGNSEFLLDIYHHKIKRLIAVCGKSYYQNFVYVEVEGMKPTGLYKYKNLSKKLKDQKCVVEEYGEYRDKLRIRRVTREEYDDGATLINGKIIDICGKVKLRARYIGKYNFLIAGGGSPINNNKADQKIKDILDKMLIKRATIGELSEFIFSLPKERY